MAERRRPNPHPEWLMTMGQLRRMQAAADRYGVSLEALCVEVLERLGGRPRAHYLYDKIHLQAFLLSLHGTHETTVYWYRYLKGCEPFSRPWRTPGLLDMPIEHFIEVEIPATFEGEGGEAAIERARSFVKLKVVDLEEFMKSLGRRRGPNAS